MLLAKLAQLMGVGIVLRPFRSSYPASVAQLVEHLICNLEVMGSSPIASSSRYRAVVEYRAKGRPPGEGTFRQRTGEYQSGQLGQTVNLMALPSLVRIQLRPPSFDCLSRQSEAVHA